jgi:coenzyme F420-reducing hydrogenase delta subunit
MTPKKKSENAAPILAEIEGPTPKLIIFACNWISYTGKDQKDDPLLHLPSTIKVIRVMCAARVTRSLLLQSLSTGIEGILILACKKCYHKDASSLEKQRIIHTTDLLQNIGLSSDRIRFIELLPSENPLEKISAFIQEIRIMGK